MKRMYRIELSSRDIDNLESSLISRQMEAINAGSRVHAQQLAELRRRILDQREAQRAS